MNDCHIATHAAGVNRSLEVSAGSYRPAHGGRTDDSDRVPIDNYVGGARVRLCTRPNLGDSATGDSSAES
jgi:hypothetical protein